MKFFLGFCAGFGAFWAVLAIYQAMPEVRAIDLDDLTEEPDDDEWLAGEADPDAFTSSPAHRSGGARAYDGLTYEEAIARRGRLGRDYLSHP